VTIFLNVNDKVCKGVNDTDNTIITTVLSFVTYSIITHSNINYTVSSDGKVSFGFMPGQTWVVIRITKNKNTRLELYN
jgi:hypothetical protein